MRSRHSTLTFLLLSVLCAPPARAENEYGVKAAYLFNFAKFIEWPKSAFASASAPVVVGIVGRDPFGAELDRAFSDATVNGRPVEIRRVGAGDAAGLRACHLLFVPATEEARTDAILAAVQGKPVAVVGESDDFARRGGVLGFVRDGGNVKFDANAKAAARNGMSISAKLLRVARRVVEG